MKTALFETLKAGLGNGLLIHDSLENKSLTIEYTSQTYDFKHVGLKLCIDRNERFKPYLHSMEDLDKEIVQKGFNDGNPFILSEWLEEKYFTLDLHKQLEQLIDDERWINHLEYLLIIHLQELHFNIHGLETDQYIRVTPENSPYK